MKQKLNAERVDRDNPEWTAKTFERAVPASEILPKLFGEEEGRAMLKRRGRPKLSEARTLISLRLPPETLARWKATGPGWQTRMAETLAKAV